MFFGEKLSALRELNGLSRKDLGLKLGITEQAVWQYEMENVVPRVDILKVICENFSVEGKYFYRPAFLKTVATEERIAYRTKDRDSRKKTKLELTYLNFVATYINYFEQFLTVPHAMINELCQNVIEMMKGAEGPASSQITSVADAARAFLKITSNQDLMYALESSGIYVVEKDLGTQIDAYSAITEDGQPFIVLGTIKKTAVQRNFDLAHELGHILLHGRVDMETLSKQEYQLVEQQADDFALAFLLPEEAFVADFKDVQRRSNPDAYIDLKRKYQVAITALEQRAYRLGLLNYQENRYFYRQRHRKGYQEFEPLDEVLVPIKPGRVRALLQVIFNQQVVSAQGLADQFHVTPEFLVRLFDLDPNCFVPYLQPQRVFFSGDNVVQLQKLKR